MPLLSKPFHLIVAFLLALVCLAGVAAAQGDPVLTTNFESPAFTLGPVTNQQGWTGAGTVQSTTVPPTTGGSQALQITATGQPAAVGANHALNIPTVNCPVVTISADYFRSGQTNIQAGIAMFGDTGFLAQLARNGGVFGADGAWHHLELTLNFITNTVTGTSDGNPIISGSINGTPTRVTSIQLYSFNSTNPLDVYFDNVQVQVVYSPGTCCNFVTGACTLTGESSCGLGVNTWTPCGACSPNPCPPVGACCDATLFCKSRTQARCASPSVTWTAGTCSPSPCTLNGRCCNFITGSCALTLQSACPPASKTWAFGGTCSPNTCDQPGACCTAGACRRLTQAQCASPSTWVSGVCSPNPCLVPFTARWARPTSNARAVATFDLAQSPTLLNPGDNSSGFGTVLTNLRIRVYGADSGNGLWTQSDFSSMVFIWNTAVNTSIEWVGQPQMFGQWGISGASDFNLFESTSGAPRGISPNQLATDSGSGEPMLLTSFAPKPTSTGSCCAVSGGCTIATDPDCIVNGGTPGATGSACSPNPCPQPGTCCDPYQMCVFGLAASCPSNSLWTLGGACSPNPCLPIGPCCSVITGACTISTQAACGVATRTWTSPGTCSPNTCDQPGACCDTTLFCKPRTEARCVGATVTWTTGTCSPTPCTLNGRCCNFITGSCALTLQSACPPASKTWAFGGTCSPNTCAQPGACCTAGACRRLTQAQCTSPSTWTAGVCSPNPCFIPFAAKWASTTTGARAVALFDLAQPPALLNPGDNRPGFGTTLKNLRIRVYGATSGNGTFMQSDFSFIAFNWPVAVNINAEWVGQPQDGQSKWGFGTSDPNFTMNHDFNLFSSLPGGPYGSNYYELRTNGASGEPMPLTSFAPIPAPGACCADTGGCTIASGPDCMFAGGTPLAVATVCTPTPCNTTGRCCNFITGSCALTLLADCPPASKTWFFGGTCSPNTCPPVGSCCNTGVCRRLSQSRCLDLSGTWTLAGVCSPNPCVPLLAAAASCPADFNNSGAADATDLFDFLSLWFAVDLRADVNADQSIGVQDVFDFLNIWLAGCP